MSGVGQPVHIISTVEEILRWKCKFNIRDSVCIEIEYPKQLGRQNFTGDLGELQQQSFQDERFLEFCQVPILVSVPIGLRQVLRDYVK